MSLYRKKPVVIEAIEFNRNARDIALFCDGVVVSDQRVDINTLEGTMSALEGDYVIKGVQGEFYPCKPDIFEATYEKVSD